MSSVLVIATVGCVLANTFVAIADYMRAPFVRENSAEVGLPPAAPPGLSWDFSARTGWAWRQESA